MSTEYTSKPVWVAAFPEVVSSVALIMEANSETWPSLATFSVVAHAEYSSKPAQSMFHGYPGISDTIITKFWHNPQHSLSITPIGGLIFGGATVVNTIKNFVGDGGAICGGANQFSPHWGYDAGGFSLGAVVGSNRSLRYGIVQNNVETQNLAPLLPREEFSPFTLTLDTAHFTRSTT